ncbi:MAG: D-TA family PLP-dependent enzyme [Chloroflexota bacterium]
MSTNWYEPTNAADIASPALLIYPERVAENIQHLIEIAGSVERLRPHVKTHKLAQVVAMHQARGIDKVKCATIAEAEMVAGCGVADVLWAYQPVGPNQQRLVQLVQQFPETRFGCLVDNETTARELSAKMAAAGVVVQVWIDIDNGNGRTGIVPGETAVNLAKYLFDSSSLQFAGLHVYDGQFGSLEIDERITAANAAFSPVRSMVAELAADGVAVPNIVAGGSPTFPVHALQTDVDLSPGTYSLWDMGYGTKLSELPFIHAAVLLTRVVSKPSENRLCLDLGHKAVAAENPIHNRVRFLNAPDATYIDQKEEHLVIELPNGADFSVGDILYGVPWHVCPTVALYQEANVIDANQTFVDRWPIVARNRRLAI